MSFEALPQVRNGDVKDFRQVQIQPDALTAYEQNAAIKPSQSRSDLIVGGRHDQIDIGRRAYL
jgi:hypothetical protein